MYERWIADDSEDLKLTKDQILDLQAKIAAVKASQSENADVLSEKEMTLQNKENVLSVRGKCRRNRALSLSLSSFPSLSSLCRLPSISLFSFFLSVLFFFLPCLFFFFLHPSLSLSQSVPRLSLSNFMSPLPSCSFRHSPLGSFFLSSLIRSI